MGDTLDFVVDCFGDVNSDSFTWNVDLKLLDAQNQELDHWNSASDFHGALGVSLPQQLAYAWQTRLSASGDAGGIGVGLPVRQPASRRLASQRRQVGP